MVMADGRGRRKKGEPKDEGERKRESERKKMV